MASEGTGTLGAGVAGTAAGGVVGAVAGEAWAGPGCCTGAAGPLVGTDPGAGAFGGLGVNWPDWEAASSGLKAARSSSVSTGFRTRTARMVRITSVLALLLRVFPVRRPMRG